MNALSRPAVQLADSDSIFPRLLSEEWRKRGYDVSVVTAYRQNYSALPDGSPVVCADDHETRLEGALKRRLVLPLLRRLEGSVPRYRKRFEHVTGIGQDTWQPCFATFANNLAQAPSMKRACMALRPRFVIGHEVTSYGVPTVLCKGVPRILFPWGGDVFVYAETSPYMDWVAKFALRRADLILPSSITGARHIVKRFGVPECKVVPLSWGVKRASFQRADPARRKEILGQLGIAPGVTVILNSRRFLPPWGCFEVLEAFCEIARRDANTHFVTLGGAGTEPHTDRARERVNAAGLASRFTILQGDAPLEVCSKLMGVSDVFVSLSGLGDMRSVSVLQAACAGGIPVISALPEYREMEKEGFRAFFTRSREAIALTETLWKCLQARSEWLEIRDANACYLARYEDWDTQMSRLVSLIEEKCTACGLPAALTSR